MDELRAIVIGLVQGLTEFLPISSSGHLIVVRELFHWHFLEDDLTFDVALHLGSTVAVLAYFWREWLAMLAALLPGRKATSVPANPGSIYNSRFLMLLVVGSPAGARRLVLGCGAPPPSGRAPPPPRAPPPGAPRAPGSGRGAPPRFSFLLATPVI